MIQFLFMVTLLSLAGGPVSASTPLSCAQEPKPASYDTLVAAGHESLEKQQWSQALNIAAAAVGVDTDRYEAYLLACLALHATARHALALEALENSIARAPEDKHTLLREIGTAIHEATNEKAFEDHLKAGREALESNLAAKAARELTAAWLRWLGWRFRNTAQRVLCS
jgi:tetratricopeptide (TPR) repeat protein